MHLCFVSVHGPREPYFVDEPRIYGLKIQILAFTSTQLLSCMTFYTFLLGTL
jgi:hypothetical protein